MRKIEFRGKRKDSGEFIYGSLVVNSHMGVVDYYITTKGMGSIYATSHKVDPKTLGQSIGITDNDGKEIYEGNEIEFDYKRKRMRGRIVWRRTGFWIQGYRLDILFDDVYRNIKIVKDIPANPELLQPE